MSIVIEDKEKHPVRIFKCKNCDHRVRFGENECGSCYAKSPILNNRLLAFLFLIILIFLPFVIFTSFMIFI